MGVNIADDWIQEAPPEYDDAPHGDDQPPVDPAPTRSMALEFSTLAEMRARVASAGPRRWLIRGLWPAGTYGVHAAEQKAQKTWNALDLAISVASGTPWLDHFEVDDPGPVIVFAGEGGEAGLVRRLDAIAASRGCDPDQLRIVVCARAPHLGDEGHLTLFAQALDRYRPKLVILDPLYLSARGANLADLYAMGALFERPQHICAATGAALWINHHHNRNRDAKGPGRMSGAGPAEWGRVLINAKVITRYTDPTTRETRVVTELDVIGGDIADDKFRIVRRIRAEDPEDLDSPLHYAAEVHTAGDPDSPDAPPTDLPPAHQKLLEALSTTPTAVDKLVDWIAEKHGHGLRRETVSRTLNDLAKRGLADCLEEDHGRGRWPLKLWFTPGPQEEAG